MQSCLCLLEKARLLVVQGLKKCLRGWGVEKLETRVALVETVGLAGILGTGTVAGFEPEPLVAALLGGLSLQRMAVCWG